MPQGIPDNIQEQQQQQQQEAAAPAPTADAPAPSGGDEPLNLFEAAAQAGEGGGRGARGAGAGAGAGAGGDAASLEFLRSNPHFQQLRQLVQQQPHMLEPILQQVAAGNPQIASLIGQNSDQFLQLLGEDIDEEEGSLPPGAQAISVTEEERDAIERVCLFSMIFDTFLTYSSCAVWASLGTTSSRPISPATRTKSWPPTSSSTNRTRMRSKFDFLAF